MKRFFTRIKRVIDWIPVLWELFEFDYSSIYLILHKHLSRMEPVIRDGYSIEADDTADEIKRAIALLEKLITDEYLEKETERFKETWGEIEMVFEDIDDEHCGFMRLDYENAKTDLECKQADEDFREAGEYADMQRSVDRQVLFNYMRDNIRKWWD